MGTKKYKDVDSNLNNVSNEKKILEYWDKNKIFEKVKDKIKDFPQWVYYDGPITANNLPHYGHAITWTVKDAVPRYWTMNGFNVIRNIGWDCQGIPVEYEVEKRQGFEKKEDIEAFGVEKFNELCRQSVLEYRGSMEKYETRLGRWLDHADEYSTMDPKYIESIWWSISQAHKKDLLYKGFKVVPYSTRAGTTLSNAEVALGGYKEIIDPAITVKFEVQTKGEFEGYKILAWTTTPWTIPGNLMLAVGKKIKYAVVESGGQNYIVAEDCVESVFKDKEYKVVKKGISADQLVGLSYTQPFNYFESKRSEGCFKVITGDHVTTEDGTGIVHLAPYGEEDFNIFMDLGVKLFDYLDETGNFTDVIDKYKGMFYKKANKNFKDSFTITGKFDENDKDALYKVMNLFVFPSLAEGFGYVLVEAMASGINVVSSDIPVLKKVGGDGVEYFKVGNVDDLYKKINEFLKMSESEKRERIALNLEKVDEYSLDAFATNYSMVYEKV